MLVTRTSAFGCGFDVYIVVADGHVCDDSEASAGGVYDLGVYIFGNGAENSRRTIGGFEYSVVIRGFAGEDGYVEVFEEAEAGLRDLTGNENLLRHGPLLPRPSL